MSAQTKPVWVWLPGEHKPVKCGEFTWEPGRGQFRYDAAYRELGKALPLDPTHLPFTRSSRPLTELKQKGLFGVFRDASPEGYGLQILESLLGTSLENLLDRMEASYGDGVGAIEVCNDIDRKCEYRPQLLDTMLEQLKDLPEGTAVSRVVRDMAGVHGTSLGGERPKMTVLHRGQQWIAKLQDRGDAPNTPLREHLAMKAARGAGMEVAEAEFHLAGKHQVLAVRRFDREVRDDHEVLRHPFASAHTLLHLDSDAGRGDPGRSYAALAHELQRWCGSEGVDIKQMKRELWRRMAFNAICGNGDDHPRNHGVLCRDGKWGLSPAYDIAPYIKFGGVLSMQVTREQHMDAARWALLRDCETFEYAEEEADAYVTKTIGEMKHVWETERAALGFKPEDAPTPDPTWLDAPPPKDLRAKRRPRARR